MITGEFNQFGDFRKIDLGEPKAKGGAGTIWTMSRYPTLVAKIYHDNLQRDIYEKKIDCMLAAPPSITLSNQDTNSFPPYTWPISKLYKNGDFCGYLMPKIDFQIGIGLERFINRKSRLIDKISNFMGNRHLIAHNLAQSVQGIHDAGHLVVDLKPQNLIVNRKNYLVTVLDADGFSVRDANGLFIPAKQFTPEYIAPEYSKRTPSDANIQQDYFALAVIIFRLFNNGVHPFQAGMKRSQKTIQQMVERKYYAYSLKGPNKLIPSRFSEHLYWPQDLRELFDQAFLSQNRPTCLDWIEILKQFNLNIQGRASKCIRNNNHVRLDGICAACELAGAKSSISKTQHSPSAMQSGNKPLESQSVANNIKLSNEIKKLARRMHARRSVYVSFVVTVLFTVIMHVYKEKNFYFTEWWESTFVENFDSVLIFFILIMCSYYYIKRGNPKLACPNCGAFKGYLKFKDSRKQFIRWLHQTKSGRRDRRYKNNEQLYQLYTDWQCSNCLSWVQFAHELSKSPNRFSTAIKTKKIINRP